MLLPKTIIIPKGVTLSSAPLKIELSDEWYELLIGIGNDHTARLLIDADAVRALNAAEPTTIIL